MMSRNLDSVGIEVRSLLQGLANRGFHSCPVLVHGSALRSSFDEHSDVDLLVIAPNVEMGHLAFAINNVRLDVAIYSIKRFMTELRHEIERGWNGLAAMVIEGVPLQGSWENLKHFCRWSTCAPPTLDVTRSINRCNTIHSDMLRNRSQIERLFLAKDFCEALAEVILRAKGHWATNGVEVLRRLRQHYPEVLHLLECAAKEYIDTSRPAALGRFMLDQLGDKGDYKEAKIIWGLQ